MIEIGGGLTGFTNIFEREGTRQLRPNRADLDVRLARLDRLINNAAEALKTFYRPGRGVFVRESTAPEAAPSPTSTSRAFVALYEYLRVLHETAEADTDAARSVVAKLVESVEKYLSNPKIREESSNGPNMFTDGHYLVAIALTERVAKLASDDMSYDRRRLRRSATRIATANARQLEEWRGGKVADEDTVHDFITLSCVRGIDAYERSRGAMWTLPATVAARVRDDVIRQLGYWSAGVHHRFDPAELTFSLSLLNRARLPEAPRLTEQALLTIEATQTSDGAWPTARVISPRAARLLHVSSYEVALALADLLARSLQLQREADACTILNSLDRAVELVAATYEPSVAGGFKGWGNDRTQGSDRVQAWVTAIVLTFLIHYRDALLSWTQQEILRKYNSRLRLVPLDEEDDWPDLVPALGRVTVERAPTRPISDPTRSGNLERRLNEVYLRPATVSVIEKPFKSSLILYGPPGTRKTTLVERIAATLGWPLLALTPPDFLRQGGLEGFEQAASEIFEDLMRLRRIVVLFDECEDFFKTRPEEARIESRTLGAFITAGMLPRLQALHDRGWVIFVLATNVELADLDEAVTRPGRFDHAQRLDHPTLEAQLRYVRKTRTEAPLASALRVWARRQEEETRIPFRILDELASAVKRREVEPEVEAIVRKLDELLVHSAPPPLA